MNNLAEVWSVSTRYNKVGVVACNDKTIDAMVIAKMLRERNIPVNYSLGKSVKNQLNFLKKRGWNSDLIFVGEEDGFFFYQDTHEYPDWLCKEYGIINFEKRKYAFSEIDKCIAEECLIELVS